MNEPAVFGTEDLRDVLGEYAQNTATLMNALHASIDSDESLMWRPHLPQMQAALAHFAELCREELGNLGVWREDGRDLEEIHEQVWEQGERLVCWLNRMLGVS